MYENEWENMEHLSNMDDRIVFLMEINAWTSILKHQLIEIKSSLQYVGNLLLEFSIFDYRLFFQNTLI